MAAGSHLLKGIWALLVIAATRIRKVKKSEGTNITKIFQWPWISIQEIEIINITSPTRLARAVTIPAASEFEFL